MARRYNCKQLAEANMKKAVKKVQQQKQLKAPQGDSVVLNPDKNIIAQGLN